MISYKIYIPTKLRFNFKITNIWFNKIKKSFSEEEYKFFIEDGEIELYKKYCFLNDKEIIRLPFNNKGIGYTRKYIVENFLLKEKDFIFFIDDDIKGFYFFDEEGKQKLFDWNKNNIKCIFESFLDSPFILTGMCYKQNQYFVKEEQFREFGRPTTFVCYNLNLLKNKCKFLQEYNQYDVEKFHVYEDIYIACCLLKSENMIGMNNKYSLFVPVMSTSKGGCFDDYKEGQSLLCAKEINRIIGYSFSEIIDNHGRVEIKINWKKLYETNLSKNKNQFF